MVLQFPKGRALRRAHEEARPALAKLKLRPAHAALAACHAELLAVTRTASALAGAPPKRKAPAGGDLRTGA